jgi:predicted nucleic acid-binding protein
MTERWVLNASPLIVLAIAGFEDLIRQLADEVIVPRAVAREILAGPADDRARVQIASGAWLLGDTPSTPAELLAWDLGAGETAVMSYALANPGWTAILDDGAARRCARTFSIPLKGTLGIILLAKRRGLISSAANVLKSVRRQGFRLDDQLIAAALKELGEENWL